jgi:hypothetical protein
MLSYQITPDNYLNEYLRYAHPVLFQVSAIPDND